MPVLTGIDVLGVQRYVFGSNRMRDAIAASSLVHWATQREGALAIPGDASVLLAAGGNAILRFAGIDHARHFVARYTRRLYDEAPGLEVAITHCDYQAGGLARALMRLQVDLAQAKLERMPSVPQLGLSVTMPCRITGLPAVGFDRRQEPPTPVSRRILRLRDDLVIRNAIGRWDDFLQEREVFDFPRDLDDLGRTREDTSMIGVVHIDGNGIGKLINEWLRERAESELDDETVQRQYLQWSDALNETGKSVLKAIVARVAGAIDRPGKRLNGRIPELGFDLRLAPDHRLYLPLRPVLLGGDDITFLCDGRIALDLAAAALDCFAREIPVLGPISACAGVAIVRSHAPFDRAYELAENLCANAKRRRREADDDTGSWIDWHIGTSPIGEGIPELRDRSYACPSENGRLELTCHPYRLDPSAAATGSWRWLSQQILGTGEDEDGFRGRLWRDHRNKIKELTSLVREGPDGVGRGRTAWTVASSIRLPGGLDAGNGFLGHRTPLLDAIELLDLHLPLAGAEPA